MRDARLLVSPGGLINKKKKQIITIENMFSYNIF